MRLLVKPLREGAQMPTYAKPGDSGMDVRWLPSTEDAERLQRDGSLLLHPHETKKLGTGLAFDIPPGHEIQVRPRSGLSGQGLLVHLGTVDNGFRGEVKVTVTNLRQDCLSITSGDRVAQLVLSPVVRPVLEQADTLSETERGADGFGSTGIK